MVIGGLFGLFGLFGQQISLYLAFNILLHALSALIVFALAFRLSRGSIYVALTAAILATTSRLALYQVTQVTGLLEGIGQLVFLSMIYCLLRFDQLVGRLNSHSLFFAYSAIFAVFLLVHTHERYFVVIPWIVSMFLLTPKFKCLSPTQRKVIIALSLMPALFNVLYKKFILHAPFFVGTGGSHIQIDVHGILIRRRLPCQGYNSKVEISDLKTLGLNTAGGRFPRDSCGRHSL